MQVLNRSSASEFAVQRDKKDTQVVQARRDNPARQWVSLRFSKYRGSFFELVLPPRKALDEAC